VRGRPVVTALHDDEEDRTDDGDEVEGEIEEVADNCGGRELSEGFLDYCVKEIRVSYMMEA